YVSIPFISQEEVEELKQNFFDTLPASGGQITADETGVEGGNAITYDFTFIDKNPQYKRKVFDIITKYFQPHVERVLADYKPIIANYIRKKPEAGEVPLHQNWAFVEERKCTSVSIWCPLVDSTVENGTLQVVPGSHKRFGEFRGPMVPWELDGIKKEIIENHLVPLETKAGDCVVLDDSIVHYSAVNKTPGLRLAIQLILIPSDFPSVHYHMESSRPQTIKMLEVDKDFYMEFNPWAKPGNVKFLKEFDIQNRMIDEEEFVGRMKQRKIDELPEERNFLQKLKAVFS
ncbi:MAG: phytanoyl-CoA dioxygenase family protein, partial [Chitinophagales bacterium]